MLCTLGSPSLKHSFSCQMRSVTLGCLMLAHKSIHLGKVVLFQVLVQVNDGVAELCRLHILFHEQDSDRPAWHQKGVLAVTVCYSVLITAKASARRLQPVTSHPRQHVPHWQRASSRLADTALPLSLECLKRAAPSQGIWGLDQTVPNIHDAEGLSRAAPSNAKHCGTFLGCFRQGHGRCKADLRDGWYRAQCARARDPSSIHRAQTRAYVVHI